MEKEKPEGGEVFLASEPRIYYNAFAGFPAAVQGMKKEAGCKSHAEPPL